MSAWLAILAVGLGSYAFRVGPLLLRNRFAPSARADDIIRQAGTAAVSALLVTSTVRVWEGGGLTVTSTVPLALGAVLAVRGASMRRVVVVGLLGQWVLDLLV